MKTLSSIIVIGAINIAFWLDEVWTEFKRFGVALAFALLFGGAWVASKLGWDQ